MNDEERGMYNTNSQIKFETSMLRSSLRDFSDAYILFKGTITIAAQAGNNQIMLIKKQHLKLCSVY